MLRPSNRTKELAMKIIILLAAVLLSLATGAAARASTTEVSAHQQVPARSEDVVAYGADTVCKLGCWG
jgi:hypothetical protein